MSQWTGRLCVDCGKRKGPKQAHEKRCYRCGLAEKKASKERAHRARVALNFGLIGDAYDLLYEAQGGRCAICRKATGKTKRLAVDHDHKCCPGRTSCGLCVRGLLCGPCNTYLGRMGDNPETFIRAADYILNPPARAVLNGEK